MSSTLLEKSLTFMFDYFVIRDMIVWLDKLFFLLADSKRRRTDKVSTEKKKKKKKHKKHHSDKVVEQILKFDLYELLYKGNVSFRFLKYTVYVDLTCLVNN